MLNRSTYQYQHKLPTVKQQRLKARIIALSLKHQRYGYRRIQVLLDSEGWQASRKLVQKVRRTEGLKVKQKKKKIPRQRVSTGLPTQANHQNHMWTWDFIFDRTDKGTSLKMMTMLDEYTRRCLVIRPAHHLTSHHVLETLSQVMALYGVPGYIRSDNGSEFIAQKVQTWLKKNRIKTIYIDLGSPWQNGYIESFHSRLKNKHLNYHRLHSRLGCKSPEMFIRENFNPKLSHKIA